MNWDVSLIIIRPIIGITYENKSVFNLHLDLSDDLLFIRSPNVADVKQILL